MRALGAADTRPQSTGFGRTRHRSRHESTRCRRHVVPFLRWALLLQRWRSALFGAAERPPVGVRVVRSLIIAIVSFLGLGFGVGDSAARCLSYEPAQVTLVGILTSRILPGPPSYRSISHGDYPETVLFLKLDEPICVSGDSSSGSNRKSHAGVTEVQILVDGVDPRRFIGKKVRASGSFFGAHMGQHRTPVVLSVVKLRAA